MIQPTNNSTTTQAGNHQPRKNLDRRETGKDSKTKGHGVRSFLFSLITPEGLVCEETVCEVSMWAIDGKMVVRGGHAPLLAALKPSYLRVRPKPATNHFLVFDIEEGIAHITANSVQVFATKAFLTDDANVVAKKATPYNLED